MMMSENEDVRQGRYLRRCTALRIGLIAAAVVFMASLQSCASPQGPLRDRLVSPDAGTRRSAFKEFGKLSTASKLKYVEIMQVMLHDADPKNQVLAADALGGMGPAAEDAVPDLVQLLTSENEDVRSHASKALADIGEVAVPSLISALKQPESAIRTAAADVLGDIGPRAKEAIPALATLLGDQEQEVSRHAATALGHIGPAAVPELIEVARWRGRYATDMASTAFASLKADAATVRELVKLMGNVKEDPAVRVFAAKAFGNMPEKAREQMPELIRVLGDENIDIRTAARWALGQTGPKGIPALREALKNSDPRVRAGAAYAIGSIGPAGIDAVPDLLQAMKDEDRTVRIDAILAIGKTQATADRVVKSLIQAMETDKDEVVRLDAMRVLSKMDSSEAKEALATYSTQSGQQ